MRIAFLLLLLFHYAPLLSQKWDHIWVIGDDYNSQDNIFGRTEIDFNVRPPHIKFYEGNIKMNMYLANVSMCDSVGNLIFYSNGCDFADGNDTYLPDGNDINPGIWHDKICDTNKRGYATGYPGMVLLPKPDSADVYYMFHQSVKYGETPSPYAFVNKLLYTVVRKSGDAIHPWRVEEKNLAFMEDSLAGGEMSAVKHANGIDWWLIQPRRNSNQFYVFLFTNAGITDTLLQTIGDKAPANKELLGQTTFAPDGARMVRYYAYNPVYSYHFDRSTGVFSGFEKIPVDFGTSLAGDGGCAISPNSRYLYIAAVFNLYQFDLQAADISASQTTVATWDGFLDPVAIGFWHSQLGPDCKIYINGGGDTRYYHIIHNPDEAGLACGVEQRGLVFEIPNGASIPYFPNYRLGPIDDPGEPCSPVVATSTPGLHLNTNVQVSPNPAHTNVRLDGLQGATTLRAYNTLGQMVAEISLSGTVDTYFLSVADWAAGLYFFNVSSPKRVLGAGRVVVAR